jgi:N-hydroxyarylamine O-acetyltransferase
MTSEPLPRELAERVLQRLGLSCRPAVDLDGLTALYGAWCHQVPFDNVRKLIHLNRKDSGPLPGDSAVDFFAAWLRHGSGGTCWAGNGALYSLLRSVGFDATRGLATMLVAPDLLPNHGTVVVHLAAERYIVDASILHGVPLQVAEHAAEQAAAAGHTAWDARLNYREGRWIIHWRPLHKPDGFDCRIDQFDVPASTFHELHEKSRAWGPFNYQLYARLNRDDRVVGTAFGLRIDLGVTGIALQRPLDDGGRVRFLIEEVGIHEELAAQLPPDTPTPPPPR